MPKSPSAVEVPVKEFFCSSYLFNVPGYQRPYAWTETQAEELFDDLWEFLQLNPEPDSIEHLKHDRSEQDILFELLLKLGLDLCVPIETKQISHEDARTRSKAENNLSASSSPFALRDFASSREIHTVHSIGSGSLLVCLSPSIPQADVEPLALGLVAWRQALKPAGDTTVVFRDSAFADDVAKTNLTAILHQHGLETVRSL